MVKQLQDNNDCSNPPDYCRVSSNSGFFVFLYLSLFLYVTPYIFIGLNRLINSCRDESNIRVEEENNNTNANGINDINDIILLPKYQSTEELNDHDIFYTLPPSYENRISTN